VRDLFDGETAEESELDNLAPPPTEVGLARQGIIERHQVHFIFLFWLNDRFV
jgi:hypothetical protein